MKKLALIIVTLLISTTGIFAQSQTCDCKADLDFVVEKLKKMPSYKKQIKGEKKDAFDATYQKNAAKMQNPISIEACYKMLLEQMLFINDTHSAIQINTAFLPENVLNDDSEFSEFKASYEFINHPKTDRNIPELKTELSQKHPQDLEGIYTYGENEKIGFYYAENKKDLIGVVLETNLKQWEVGEIRCYATHTNANKYDLYYYKTDTRSPAHFKSLSFENGRLWSYKKVGNTNNFEFADNNNDLTIFKQINDDTQYIYFKSFSNRKEKALKQFFEDTKDKLTAKNIIVDLRSNSGGNSKYSDVFLKLLKNKNVYVLTNCFTGSNGEQFTLKLLKNKKAKHLGQTTFGVIAYGINHGYNYNTPSGHFKITPTDMNFHKYFDYEGKGITPEIPLDFNRDWIAQTLDIIEADSK
ncbi:MAG: hypothetical protein Tsb0033_24910 [Winogradskyella sp.]